MINHENKTPLQGIGKCLKRTQECLRLTWECLKKDICECPYTYFKTIFFFFLLIAIWLGFEEKWLSLFDNYIGGWLHLPGHWSIKLVIGFGLLGLSLPFYQWYKKCYQITPTIWTLLIFCLVVLLRYHITPSTQYNPQIFLGFLTYFNLIFIVLLLFFSLLLVNRIRIQAKKHANKLENKTISLWQIDEPIKEDEEDVYHWREDAQKLIKEMDALSLSECAFKIGIVAPWGAGKSSYLNLLKKELKTKDYIVIDFNPRNAKECLSIQELFFHTLSEQLKQYHSGLSSLFQKYMLALQLISPEGWLSRSLSAFRELGRKEIRKELNATIKDLPFRVVIVIEDLDRLVREEILEIFKLLDTSASFPNTIYLTAYDKEYIKRMWHNDNENNKEDTSIFSDKFLDLEYPIPLIPIRILMEQLNILITENLGLRKCPTSHDSPIKQIHEIFPKYLHNMRDIKRYVNLISTDYPLIKEYVLFEDFLLISLIKYKSSTVYKQIYYLDPELIQKNDTPQYEINYSYTGPFKDIISILFSSDTTSVKESSIRYRSSFSHYFETNLLTAPLIKRLHDFIQNEKVEDAIAEIDNVFRDLDKKDKDDVIDYFEKKDLLQFPSIDILCSHIEVLLYLYYKEPSHELRKKFFSVFFEDIFYSTEEGEVKHQKNLLSRYNIKKEELREKIERILKERWEYYSIIGDTMSQIIDKTNTLHTEKPLFSKEELLSINRNYLKEKLEAEPEDILYLNILYQCPIEIQGANRKVILDKDCLKMVKECIKKYPRTYLNHFVRVPDNSGQMIFINPEAFWKSIFGNEEKFEKFILSENVSRVEKIELVRNFWEIFKKNEYEHIILLNLELDEVKKMIDDDLKTPINWLKELENLEKEIQSLSSSDKVRLKEIEVTI